MSMYNRRNVVFNIFLCIIRSKVRNSALCKWGLHEKKTYVMMKMLCKGIN